jgi:hypothetical protein
MMLWLPLLLLANVALAEDLFHAPAPSPDPDEPAFCSDPVAAICEPSEKTLPNYAETRRQLDELIALKPDKAAFKARLAKFQEVEKQSFIPLLDESRIRLLEAIGSIEGLDDKTRDKVKEILSKVKFISLSGAADAKDQIEKLRKELPQSSILKQRTAEAQDIIRNLRFEMMTPTERDLVRLMVQTIALDRAQTHGCGEEVPLNAFSLGDVWGLPSVTLCFDSVLRLQPLDVQARYPMLGMVFSHELGHHIDVGPFPQLYSKYLSCLHDEAPDGGKRFRDDWAREISADFWSAIAIGNMLKTRAALLEEPPEAERNRAYHFVRGSLHWLCNVPVGPRDTHPPPTWRIAKIFGQSPEIRKMLGCKPKPSCGLSGRK